MTIHKFQTDAQRQAEALDKVEKIIERSTWNMDRYRIWRERFDTLTYVKPDYTTTYPTPNKKGHK